MTPGSIDFEGGSVGVGTKRARFLVGHPDAKLILESHAHRTYSLGPTVALGRNVFANLSFFDEDLRMVTLVPISGDRRQWTEITDSELAIAKERNDEWLATAYGVEDGAASYTWGSIESVIDKKTGCAQVVVTYWGPVAELGTPSKEV